MKPRRFRTRAWQRLFPAGLRLLTAALLLLTYNLGPQPASADHAPGGGQSFTFLQAGFTQDIYGVGPNFMGGVAFAPDGDPLVNHCQFSGSSLDRFDRQAAPLIVNTTPVQPMSVLASNAGCGMTNHPSGGVYSNLGSGVIKLDPNTGGTLAGPFGPGGNALGIAPDPQTGNLVYVGNDGTVHFVNAALTTSGTFSTVTTGNFVDGIYFDPSGEFLFLSNRSPAFRLTVIRRDGTLVQHAIMTSEPDGIAFRAASPKFVVTNNTDGTMTRFDFPGDDYTQPPVQSVFASGGFRGDLSQVGPDSCLYLTQAGTRYNDGAVSFENSLVRICPGFSVPPGVGSIALTPLTAENPVGTAHTVTATVTKDGSPDPGKLVTFSVISGPNAGASGVCAPPSCVTNAAGQVSWTYTGGATPGIDTIQACFTDDTGFTQCTSVTKEWVDDGGGETATHVSAGRYFTCSLTGEDGEFEAAAANGVVQPVSAGGVQCWGRNNYGQLGNGSTTASATPVNVVGLGSDIAAISAGDYHACAVKSDGTVWCWGRNNAGQLGNGSTANSSTPVQVSGLTDAVGISAGAFHTCAVTSAGAAKCWGQGTLGQLGNGSTANSNTPVQVSGLTTGVAAVSAGYSHSCALTDAGAVKCWGNNALGQIGDGTNSQRTTPVQVSGLTSGITQVSTGDYNTCALSSGGGVKCWGDNSQGQVGDGATTQRTTPTNVSGLGSGVSQVSAGRYFACALTGGTVKCWGDNTLGQLGNGGVAPSAVPVNVTVLSGSAVEISAGSYHGCAVLTDDTIECWGASS